MLEDFRMEISKADFLRIVNAGVKELNSPLGSLITSKTDRVQALLYNRNTHRYTLYFESGVKVRVVEPVEPQQEGAREAR